MLEIRVNCPSCGAPLSFRPGTMVAVCSYCRALAARTDRDPKLIGKVADLVATGSRLALAMEGSFAGRTFKLAGRTQLRHPLGGVWDEWYLSFGDGRWGWLAEAQGKFYLTFKQDLTVPPPPPEALQPGQELDLGSAGKWAVAEVSQAALASAEGEIPWSVEDLGATYPFADLHGRNGAFATLDFSDDVPMLFSGRETTLPDLKLTAIPPMPGGAKVKGQSLPCPHCASPLKLQAPDSAERVVCPSCSSLLDASEGRLTYLKSLKQPEARMFIPLGHEGTLRGHKVICAGFMVRSCSIEGETFPWREYLLLDQEKHAFLWLVESDGHWSLAETVNQGDLSRDKGGHSVQYRGETLKRYQHYEAVVQGVWGEFYWKVEQGEKASVIEYTKAPQLLAEERQKHGDQGAEVNWSLSTYLEPAEVWQAFQLQGAAPTREGIAPHQPNPHLDKASQLFKWMWAGLAVWLLVLTVQCATHRNTLLYSQTFNLTEAAALAQAAKAQGKPIAEGADPGEVVFFSTPIEVKEGQKNLEVRAMAALNNGWIDVDGALASNQSSAVELFRIPLSYYQGVDEGERWTEGNPKDTVYLSALPAGTYILRLAPQWEGLNPPSPVLKVEIRNGVMHGFYWLLALFAVIIPPIIQRLRASSFEGQRWANAMTGGEH